MHTNRRASVIATTVLLLTAATMSLAGAGGEEAPGPTVRVDAAHATVKSRYEPTWMSLARP